MHQNRLERAMRSKNKSLLQDDKNDKKHCRGLKKAGSWEIFYWISNENCKMTFFTLSLSLFLCVKASLRQEKGKHGRWGMRSDAISMPQDEQVYPRTRKDERRRPARERTHIILWVCWQERKKERKFACLTIKWMAKWEDESMDHVDMLCLPRRIMMAIGIWLLLEKVCPWRLEKKKMERKE